LQSYLSFNKNITKSSVSIGYITRLPNHFEHISKDKHLFYAHVYLYDYLTDLLSRILFVLLFVKKKHFILELISGPEILDDFGETDVTSGEKSDEPDDEEGRVPHDPEVHPTFVRPEGDRVDDGGSHQGQGRRADGPHQRDEEVQAGNGGAESD
jgi:hypothetical protein